MYMVYWSTGGEEGWLPQSRGFPSEDMVGAMKFMEELRARQRDGEAIAFVVLSSENPHSVGKPGVADPDPEYSWKKRRR